MQDKLKKKRKDGSDLDEEELREILAKYEADRKRLEDVRAAEKAKISAKLAKKLADKQNGNASNKLQDVRINDALNIAEIELNINIKCFDQ